MDLSFRHLPDLPQSAVLQEIACEVAAHPEVMAIWLGGSIATGTADRFSDLDLRIAVHPDQLDRWRVLSILPGIEARCAGSQFLTFGPAAFLHAVLLSTGETCDLFVQSIEEGVFTEPRIVLGCRDPLFARKLEASPEPAAVEFPPASPEDVLGLLTAYWLNSEKHVKVLSRGLDLVAWAGINRMRGEYVRLRCILHTGSDCGDLSRADIHSLTPVSRELQTAEGEDLLAVIGAPATDRRSLCDAIDTLHDAVAAAGRSLSVRLGFPYPTRLEQTVRRIWQAFVRSQRPEP